MKRALAKLLQSLADRLDPVLAYDRQMTEKQLARALTDNLDLHEQIAAARPLTIPEVAPEWTPENATGLAIFLATDTGKAFSKRLISIAAAVAINGARNTANTIHAAGMSAGWDEAVRTVHSLSRVSRVPDTTPDKRPQGETDLLEQLSP